MTALLDKYQPEKRDHALTVTDPDHPDYDPFLEPEDANQTVSTLASQSVRLASAKAVLAGVKKRAKLKSSYQPVISRIEDGAVRVQSESKPEVSYIVRLLPNGTTVCNCPARSGCKHQEIALTWMEENGSLPDPESLFPAEDEDAVEEEIYVPLFPPATIADWIDFSLSMGPGGYRS